LTRLNDVLWICKKLKEKIQIFIRVNTNGHVTLRYPNRDVAKELSKVIDSISISLNAENEKNIIVYADQLIPMLIKNVRIC